MSEGRKHAHLTEEELAEFQEIFNLVDLDKGGTISKDELKQLMNTLGLKPTQASSSSHGASTTARVDDHAACRPPPQEELNQMVDEIDADGNGEIDFDGAPAADAPCHLFGCPRQLSLAEINQQE